MRSHKNLRVHLEQPRNIDAARVMVDPAMNIKDSLLERAFRSNRGGYQRRSIAEGEHAVEFGASARHDAPEALRYIFASWPNVDRPYDIAGFR